MPFPIKTCAVCSEDFELKPDKPGFANRCPECSAPESSAPDTKTSMDADERRSLAEANEARRQSGGPASSDVPRSSRRGHTRLSKAFSNDATNHPRRQA